MIEVADEHLQSIKEILRRAVPQCEVRAFGSRVQGSAKKHSDLDLALIGPTELSLAQLAQLRAQFEESDIPFRVDFVDWATIDDSFRAIIEKKYVVIQMRQGQS